MLHDNSITDKALWPLCKAVRRHPSLNAIWIGKNQISDEGAAILALLIEKNHMIKELNLSNKWPQLRWLKTEHRDHPHVSYIGASKIASALATCAGLTSLSLHDQYIQDRGAIALFAAIPESNLVTLHIGKNEITDKCCSELSKCLTATFCPLRELFLDHNEIGDSGAVMIGRSLARNSRLYTLDLNSNRLGEQGMEALYESLFANSVLEALMVRNNMYSSDAVDSLMAERKSAREKGDI